MSCRTPSRRSTPSWATSRQPRFTCPPKGTENRGNGTPYLVVSASQDGYEASVLGVPESATYRITFNGPGEVESRRIKARKPQAPIPVSREYHGATIVM